MTSPAPLRRIFITGGTGYLGTRLVPRLMERGHAVSALARQGSVYRLPNGCNVIMGDPLDRRTFAERVRGMDTFVQLVGAPHPAPWKDREFRRIDRVSARESIAAAEAMGAPHFVYVSVANPAPTMKAYIEVRKECEALIRASGLPATILRPWYILGPGHWWTVFLKPGYWLWGLLPSTREAAVRLGLVTLEQMLAALVWAVEHPPDSVSVIEVPAIKQLGRGGQ